MAQYGELGFGIRDARLTPLPSGTAADLPRIQGVEANVVTDSATLPGDDVIVGVHDYNLRIEGSLTAGGINPAALAIMIGATVTTVVGPPAKKTISITSTTVRGYFKFEGQIIADDAGDFHAIIYKAKVTTGPSFAFNNGEFVLTNASITGVADGSGKIMDLVWEDAIVPITP